MAGEDLGLLGQSQQAGVDGVDDLAWVSAGEVGAADAAGEEGVAGDEQVERGEVEAHGALGVARSVDDLGGIAVEANEQAVGQVFVRRGGFRGVDSQPTGLLGHDFELGQVVFIHEDGSAGELF